MISYKELRHLRMLAAIREGYLPEDQLKYLGMIDGEHTYLIDNKHVVKLDEIVDFEEINYGYSSTYKVAQIEIYRTYSSNYSLWRNSSYFSMGGGIQGTYKSDRQFIHWRDVYESDSFSLYEKETRLLFIKTK